MAVVLTALLVALALLVVVVPSGVGAALTQDGSALLSLKAGFGDPLGRLHNWRAGDSTPCAWIGVTCNASAVVTSLNLAGMNLSGTVSDDIQLLSGLASLNLSSNLLTGPLPLSLANLTSLLSLDISRNGFNGSFPRRGFFRLKMLTTFSGYSNDFTGSLPVEFVHLPDLQHFDLGGSYFEGPIPPEYGAFSSLLYLDLSGNKLNGSIPPELGNLPCIKWLKIGWNQYEGGIPPHLGNLSTLEFLDLASASLTGTIPSSLGKLHNLNTLFLYQNLLSSAIPAELGNLTKLQSLDLSQNWLTGGIPSSLARLQQLRRLGLMYNRLSGEIPVELADLPELRTFQVWNNSLSGSLPQRLGQASALVWVDVSGNRLEGQIPPFLCAGGKLYKLMLFSNKFSGRIPPSLAHCPALWRLRIEDNQLTGGIPRGFGKLPNLTYVDMSRNMLTGGIPYDLTAAPELKLLYVSGNPLGGSIPTGLWKMRSLQKLYASSCNLTDRLSLLANQCPPLIALDLSGNSFTGSIPDNIGQCQKLIYLDLHRNRFDGIIPAEIARLPVLATLDLSHNMLAGPIPNGFQNCTALEALDLSYNNLSGAIPTEGVFKFMNPAMLSGNPGLKLAISGGNSNKARNEEEEKQQQRIEHPLAWSIVGLIFALTLVILALGSSCFYKRYKWYICSKMKCANVAGAWKLTAFQKLNFTVEDILQCLTSSNIVGMGAAGTVYRAETGKGETIAVKKLWRRGEKEAEEKPGRKEIPLGEVEVLGSVRHRNIVRLLGHCSNSETTLLLYEYMPNGSLGELLHGTKGGDGAANLLADWLTRHRIAMGVAQGLSYLHHDCFPVIIHRDVKSNNILLDSSMEARVADFGVAKLIETTQSMSVVAGSYGYIAPEYAYTMQVDEKSDIYSFGVVLLEILTGKRPSEAEYGGGEWSNIVDWARDKSRTCQGLKDLLDSNVGASSLPWVREEMALVLRVALLCTSKSPVDRPSMRDVVTMLSEAQPRRKTTTTTTTTTTTSPVKELPSL